MLGEIERQQRPHAVIAEPLPHLGGEQPRKLARVAEPGLLVGGIGMPDAGENGSSTAGVSTIRILPCAAARAGDRNGQIPPCEADCCARPAPLSAPANAQRPLVRPLAAPNPPLGKAARAGRAGPDAGRAGAHPDDRRAHAGPWQAVPVALRHGRRRPARRLRGAAAARRWSRTNPDATDRASPEGGRIRPLCRAAGRAGLRAASAITRSRCGSRSCRAARRG